MKQKFINKIILATMITTTLSALAPIKASAQWANDYQGNWYYMQNNQKSTGWIKIDGKLYYFDDNGRMQKGWIKAGSSWYFLQSDGTLQTGWIKYNKDWYYADSDGSIQTGIIEINGKIYAFDSNGVMKNSNTIINGAFYTINSDGAIAGSVVPTPDKEFDSAGKCIRVLNNTDNNASISPTSSKYDEAIKDESYSNGDPKDGVEFKLTLKDSNGAELDSKTVKYNKTVDLGDFDEPTKAGYVFKGWNTKSDGSGKSYDAGDDIKIKGNTTLYAEYSDDASIYADDITISGNSYVTINKAIQMTAQVSPSNVSNNSVTWSVVNGTGQASIDSNGVLTGVSAGTVTVKAATKDGSNLSVTKEVTVSATDIVVNVNKITITSKTGTTSITTDGGTLQMVAAVAPDDANNKGVTWSIENKTGSASIDSNGLLTAISNGTVTVKATANDGSGIVGITTVTISNQSTKISIDSVSISTQNDAKMEITTNGGTLQLIANVLPTTASNKAVQWSITDGQDKAAISSTGKLTAFADGIVTVKVKTLDGSKEDTKQVTISNQAIKVSKITITGPLAISGTAAQTMQAKVEGKDSAVPTNSTLKWTVQNESGSATINQTTGVLTPMSDGNVLVKAIAADGSGISDTKEVTISGTNIMIPVTGITIAPKDVNGSFTISNDDGTLELSAAISPSYASTTSAAVTWEVVNGDDGGSASIVGSTTGSSLKIQGVSNGTVTVRATAPETPGSLVKKTGTATVRIRGQIQQVTKVNVTTQNLIVGVGETLQMQAAVEPSSASNKNIKWEVSNGSGAATFDSSTNGLLKGVSAGTVTVRAVSADAYGCASDPVQVTVKDPIPATTVTVSTLDNSNNEITTDHGTLKLAAVVDDAATNKTVTWSTDDTYTGVNGKGKASIVDNGDSTSTLTAVENGDVRVIATGSGGKIGDIIIKISGQKATSLAVNGYNGVNAVNAGNKLQMQYSAVPISSTTPAGVTWSVSDTSNATIDQSTGELTALYKGTVVVTAKANDPQISGTATITINPLAGFQISSPNTQLIAGGNSIQLGTNISQITSIDPSKILITWSITSGTQYAGIGTNNGVLTGSAGSTGKSIVVHADVKDSSGRLLGSDELPITIS